MKVKVKLLAAAVMPAGFDEFGERQLDLPAGASLADVMAAISLPAEEVYTALVGGQAVQPDARAGHTLSDGDEITLLPAIQGG